MKSYLLVAACLSLTACGTTYNATILPQQNNTYSSIASSSDRKDALVQAAGKADQVCKKQEKRLIVLNRDESAEGDSDNAVTKAAKALAGKFLGMGDDDAYSVTLLFRCE